MKYLMLFVLVCSSLAAKDQWVERWEGRIAESDNPEAKAQDMVSDWIFDHRGELRGLDPTRLAEGQRIMDWMADHDIQLPSRARAAYDQVKTALAGAGRGEKSKAPDSMTTLGLATAGAGDEGLSGDILPRSQTELNRQAADDLRFHGPRISEPTQR